MGQSVFSQLKRSTMRPFVAIAFILGSVYGAPSNLLPAGYAAGHLAAAPVAVAHAAPVAVAHAAPVAVAAAPAVSLPAPYSVDTQAEGVTTVHQPAPVVTKQVHYGQTSYVSGYNTAIHKPPTPHLPIQVPTVLKGTHTVNAPIVKTQTQIHTVNEPVYVERRVEVPYDVPVYKEQIVEVPHPVPVAGEPIVKKTVAAPIVTHSHHTNVAAPAYGYAAAPLAVAH